MHPPLWKQLLGAGIGTLAALAVYGLHMFVTPRVVSLFPGDRVHSSAPASYTEEDRMAVQSKIVSLSQQYAMEVIAADSAEK